MKETGFRGMAAVLVAGLLTTELDMLVLEGSGCLASSVPGTLLFPRTKALLADPPPRFVVVSCLAGYLMINLALLLVLETRR